MGSWDVVVSSLQDTSNSNYLMSLNTPAHSTPPSKQDLEGLQKHKDNLSKTHRILSTALENVIELQKASICNIENKAISSNSQQLENPPLPKSIDIDSNDNSRSNAKDKDKNKYKAKNKNKIMDEVQDHEVDKIDNVAIDNSYDLDNNNANYSNNNNDNTHNNYGDDVDNAIDDDSSNDDDDDSNKENDNDSDDDKIKEQETRSREDIKSNGKELRSLSNDSKNKSVKKQKPGRSFYQSPYNPSSPIYPGDEVAYKPRGKSDTEWIQCKVLKVINEVKFEIKDPEPDDRYPNGQLFRCTYKDLILLPNAEILSGLKNYPIGMKVLARYPETTTFYPAEIMGYKKDGTCKLRFEGEEEVGKLTEVERKLVLPYAK